MVATGRNSARRFGAGCPLQSQWGPIQVDDAKAAGALAAAASVLLGPDLIDSAVVNEAVRVAPLELYPLKTDTRDTLRDRIAQSTFFDDARKQVLCFVAVSPPPDPC